MRRKGQYRIYKYLYEVNSIVQLDCNIVLLIDAQ